MNSSNEDPGLFRPYRFPDLPHDTPEPVETGPDDFRRLAFDENGRPEDPAREIARRAEEAERLAYAKGFSQGEENGILAGREKVEPVLSALTDLLAGLSRIREEMLRNAEKEAVELALAISEKIIAREVSANGGIVAGVVREALREVVDQDDISVRLNPDDLEFVRETKHEFSDLVRNIDNLSFEPDESVTRGGCHIETNFGDIDARIEQKIELVRTALRNAFDNRFDTSGN